MATSKKASKTKKKAKKAPAKKAAKKKTAAGKTGAQKKTATGKKKTAATKKPAAKEKAVKKKAVKKKTAARKPAGKGTNTVKPTDSVNASPAGINEVDPPRKGKKTPANVRSGLRKIKQTLLEKRHLLFEQLQAELKEMERPEKRHRADLEEIASDTHDSDSLCQIMDINASQLDQIDAALKKIDDSTYGICEDCEQEIPLPRLEALPFATQCIECKRKAELSQVRPAEYYSAGFDG